MLTCLTSSAACRWHRYTDRCSGNSNGSHAASRFISALCLTPRLLLHRISRLFGARSLTPAEPAPGLELTRAKQRWRVGLWRGPRHGRRRRSAEEDIEPAERAGQARPEASDANGRPGRAEPEGRRCGRSGAGVGLRGQELARGGGAARGCHGARSLPRARGDGRSPTARHGVAVRSPCKTTR